MFTKSCCISNDTRIMALLAELQEIEWDIILLSETHASTGYVLLTDGYRLITILATYIASGVGILLHSRLTGCVRGVSLVMSDRVLSMDLCLQKKMVLLKPLKRTTALSQGGSGHNGRVTCNAQGIGTI